MRGHPGALIELLLPLVYSSYLARSKLHPFIIDPIGDRSNLLVWLPNVSQPKAEGGKKLDFS